MPVIKSISALRNRTREIATLCREQDVPVFLTTNGEGDLVVMSINHYERISARLDLYEKLDESLNQLATGEKGFTHKQVVSKLRQRINVRK
ncbi:MAG: type II toxin-antitoxin system prevent-host-death family antitoxin [Ignavibacteriales bacterium]|nr:type II toxin-antitoxin system prevent-host-death family antitoxin [Ignavibacteriales bacterium]